MSCTAFQITLKKTAAHKTFSGGIEEYNRNCPIWEKPDQKIINKLILHLFT